MLSRFICPYFKLRRWMVICGDMLHYSVDGQPSDICDGVVAGMTLVHAVVLTAEQVGVDRDWYVTKVQIKEFIRQSEIVSAFW